MCAESVVKPQANNKQTNKSLIVDIGIDQSGAIVNNELVVTRN